MANQLEVTDDLRAYVRRVSLREDDVLRDLRDATTQLPMGTAFQVMAEEGQLLALLVSLCGAEKIVEVGTFTGYSTLCMARALPPGGTIHTCDIAERWAPVAVEHWKRADVTDRIDFRVGDGRRFLADLRAEFGPDSADFGFIDADKVGYLDYYEGLLELVRPGGLIVVDNTLLFGRVLDPKPADLDAAAINALNEFLRDDERVEIALIPMADGITLARKR
jgi:O-methyltransferase